jgi:hypothetical protein
MSLFSMSMSATRFGGEKWVVKGEITQDRRPPARRRVHPGELCES